MGIFYQIQPGVWIPPGCLFVCVCIFLTIYLYRSIKFARLFNSVSHLHRGTRSERQLVTTLLKSGIPPHTIFHDAYIQKKSGRYTQIDVIVPTKAGILVFEVKEYAGWIFGTGNQTYWTQVLSYGKKKYRIYNPIRQNENHIIALKDQLTQFQHIPFYSIIVFYGDCVLKNISHVPNGTYIVPSKRIMELYHHILVHNPPAPYTNKQEVLDNLTTAIQKGRDKLIRREHLAEIEEMLGRDRIRK